MVVQGGTRKRLHLDHPFFCLAFGLSGKNVLYYITMDPLLGVEKSKNHKGIIVLAVLGIVFVVVIAFLWYWTDIRKEREVAEQVAQELQQTAQAVETIVSPPALTTESVTPPTNPVEDRVPEVNPVERANPFADEYENPFE